MATQVNTRISPLSPPGIHGVDAKDIFVVKWETFNDQLRLDFVVQANAMADEINIVSANISASAEAVDFQSRQVAEQSQQVSNNAAKVEQAKQEVEEYVIPTEATYNPKSIDDKVRMSQTLYLTGA